MRSRLSRLLGLFLMALAIFGDGATEALGEVPDSLTSADRDQPVWRSLAAAVSDGAMRWELFSDIEKHVIGLHVTQGRKLLHGRDAKAGTCLEIEPLIGDVPVFETLAATAEQSVAIYVGTVTDAEPGFLGSLLGTVYEVSVDQDLKGGTVPVPQQVLFFYPAAEARVEGVSLCPTGFRDSVRPAVGGRLLLFASDAVLSSGPVLRPNDSDLVFQTVEGALSVPSSLRDLADLDLTAKDLSLVESVIQEAVAHAEERR